MTKLWSWVLMALVASCIAAGSALAAEAKKERGDKPRPSPEDMFKRLDKDGDGKLTLAEFTGPAKDDARKQAMEKRFKALDKGNKGFITLDDLKAAPRGGKERAKERKKEK